MNGGVARGSRGVLWWIGIIGLIAVVSRPSTGAILRVAWFVVSKFPRPLIVPVRRRQPERSGGRQRRGSGGTKLA